MNKNSACLSENDVSKLQRHELSPVEIETIEIHVGDCQQCSQLLGSIESDPLWTGSIRPALLEAFKEGPTTTEPGNQPNFESVLKLLGPSDDANMLGRVGTYEVVGIIGQGGMGVVFKAFDTSLNRFVAIKMLLPHLTPNGSARKRFLREAQAAAAVVDDHVLPIFGVDEWQGTPYLVMQYCRGETLQQRIQRQGALELKEILRIGLQSAKGLAAAHAQGLVHRDVKPSNILLDGSVERALITDFGLARAADDASLTRTGIVSGTPQYMSPEQIQANTVDSRSDLFSLGSTMYAMCTGRPPFRSESAYGVMHRIIKEEPTNIREINPELPAWMSGLVARLMSKQAGKRCRTASELAELLEGCLGHVQQPTQVPLPKAVEIPNPNVGISRIAKALIGVVVAALIFVAGYLIFLESYGRTEAVNRLANNHSIASVPLDKHNIEQFIETMVAEQESIANANVYFRFVESGSHGNVIENFRVCLDGENRRADFVSERSDEFFDKTVILTPEFSFHQDRVMGSVTQVARAPGEPVGWKYLSPIPDIRRFGLVNWWPETIENEKFNIHLTTANRHNLSVDTFNHHDDQVTVVKFLSAIEPRVTTEFWLSANQGNRPIYIVRKSKSQSNSATLTIRQRNQWKNYDGVWFPATINFEHDYGDEIGFRFTLETLVAKFNRNKFHRETFVRQASKSIFSLEDSKDQGAASNSVFDGHVSREHWDDNQWANETSALFSEMERWIEIGPNEY